LEQEPTNPKERFEPFPAVAGIGWKPVVGVGFLGLGSAIALSVFILYPIFIEDTTSSTASVMSRQGVYATLIVIAVAWLLTKMPRQDSRVPMRISAIALTGVGLVAAVSPEVNWDLLLVVGAVFWVPGVVHHRAYLADLYGRHGHFRVLGMYWSGVAVGAVVPLMIGGYLTDVRADSMSVLAGVSLVGFGASFMLPRAEPVEVGIETTSIGWPRRARLVAGSLGALVAVGLTELVSVMDVTWNINEEGTVSTVGGAALVLVAVLLFGHWYHSLESVDPERYTNTARLSGTIGVLLLIASAFSTTLIGMVIAAIAAGTAIGFMTLIVDVATLSDLSSRARRVATASQLVWFAAGGLLATLFADQLLTDWTPRSVIVLAGVPLLVTMVLVGRGTRKRDVTHSDAIRKAAIERQAVEATSLLTVRSVDVSYGSVQVLFDIDFEVVNSEIVAVMGTNGAGKTTLLRTIAGLEQPTNGRIVFGGADATEFEATWMTELGVCHIAGPESVAPTLTVEENLRMFSHSLGRNANDVDERIDEAYDLFPRLGERRTQRASTLSGGEKQMLALSKAVILKPRILLIDEFSLGLAPKVVSELLPTVQAINRAGTAVILVEQNVATALSIADRAYVIEKGEMLWFGEAGILKDDPRRIEQMYLAGTVEEHQ